VGGTALTDLSGYKVLYGTSPNSLTNSVSVSGAATTSTSIGGLSPGTYYFAVVTLNAAGVASLPSNVASKVVQ
jgi:hypothetical protein